MRVAKLKGETLLPNMLRGSELKLRPRQCKRVRKTLLALHEAGLRGHDSWPANFIASSEKLCPVYWIDMTMHIWDVVPWDVVNMTGRLFGESLDLAPLDAQDKLQNAALRFFPPLFGPPFRDSTSNYQWWPNCRVLSAALSCPILCDI